MPSFTGYEPKNSLGKGIGPISLEPAASGSHPSSVEAEGNLPRFRNPVEAPIPISLEPAAQRVSPTSIQAEGNLPRLRNPAVASILVQADFQDTLAEDLGSMMETSMISVEDFLAEPIVQVQQQQSPSHHQSRGQPTAASIVTNVPSSTQGGGQPTAATVTSEANEVKMLGQKVDTIKSRLLQTEIIAENYAEHIKTRSHLKAKEALSYQKNAFEKKSEEFSFSARDICRSEVAHSNAILESDANSVVIQAMNVELSNASSIVTNSGST